jgi:hypothetical protein
MPHAERRAHEIARHIGDEGGARVHDHGELAAGGDKRRRCDGIWRIDPAGKRVDLVLSEQFLDRGLGFAGTRKLRVALDERDRIGFDLIGIELEILFHAAVHLLSEFGTDARIGQDDADFHFLRRCLLRHGAPGRDRKCGDSRDHSFGHEKPSQLLQFQRISNFVRPDARY